MASCENILMPRDAAKYISQNSKDVKICTEGVRKTADIVFNLIKNGKSEIDVKRWTTHDLNPKRGDQAAVHWVFLSDLLNFSFWSEDETNKYVIKYQEKEWTGYWSLCACINRALDEGILITDATYFKDVTLEELKTIFRSDSQVPMPLIEERLKVLHEAGNVLCQKYDGSFVNVIKKADKSAQKLLQLIVQDFPSFCDVAEFQGAKVAFYKRAQILIADLWACCAGEGYGEFHDIDTITMFADYRIPQALVWFGALEYSEGLKTLLDDAQHRFKSGDAQEVEIRGASIHAVDLVVEEVKRRMREDVDVSDTTPVNAVLIDHFLWDYRRQHAKDTQHIPIHKIRCIYY